jgi:septum formation protein
LSAGGGTTSQQRDIGGVSIGKEKTRLVLASASETRGRILLNAGIDFVRDPADVDESAIKLSCRRRGVNAEEAALVLAESKARAVATRHPGAVVVGADQLLVSGADWLDKPGTADEARETLRRLRNRRHRLISGLAVLRDDLILCRHVEVAELAMRNYSDRFIDWYMETAGEADIRVVGACRLEGLGAQAFARIDGDYFTILGLPLLPLLEVLRREAVLID